jgi:transcriptional regulator with XRE-family HTH domain
MPITSTQLRMARAALKWTVRDLAKAAGVHPNTITNLEIERFAGDTKTWAAIEKVLTHAGVEFIDYSGSPGVRVRILRRLTGGPSARAGPSYYVYETTSSTQYVGTISGAQCRSARALLTMTQPELARAAGVGLSTVVDFERQRRQVSPEAARAIRLALEAAGIQLIDEDGGGPGVRLRKPQRGKGRK